MGKSEVKCTAAVVGRGGPQYINMSEFIGGGGSSEGCLLIVGIRRQLGDKRSE